VDKVLAQFLEASPTEKSRWGDKEGASVSLPYRASSAVPAFSVARVRGLAGGEGGADERHALTELARSLGLVLQSSSMTVSLEALHEYFKVICLHMCVPLKICKNSEIAAREDVLGSHGACARVVRRIR
jgi:hypothetical protein